MNGIYFSLKQWTPVNTCIFHATLEKTLTHLLTICSITVELPNTWTIKSSRLSVGLRRISGLGFVFCYLQWYKLAHICIEVNSLHRWNKQEINRNFLTENQFHVTLRIVSPYICKQCQQVKRWKAKTTAKKANNLKTKVVNHTIPTATNKTQQLHFTSLNVFTEASKPAAKVTWTLQIPTQAAMVNTMEYVVLR